MRDIRDRQQRDLRPIKGAAASGGTRLRPGATRFGFLVMGTCGLVQQRGDIFLFHGMAWLSAYLITGVAMDMPFYNFLIYLDFNKI